MTEELSDFPAALRDTETYPWEEQPEPVLWPFGASAGTPLGDFSTLALHAKRKQVEAKNGNGHYFDALLTAIDEIILDRRGEIC